MACDVRGHREAHVKPSLGRSLGRRRGRGTRSDSCENLFLNLLLSLDEKYLQTLTRFYATVHWP